jgi:hypothetical protein
VESIYDYLPDPEPPTKVEKTEKPHFPGEIIEVDGSVQGGEAPSSTGTDKDKKYSETAQEFVKNYIERNNLKDKGFTSIKNHGTF